MPNFHSKIALRSKHLPSQIPNNFIFISLPSPRGSRFTPLRVSLSVCAHPTNIGKGNKRVMVGSLLNSEDYYRLGALWQMRLRMISKYVFRTICWLVAYPSPIQCFWNFEYHFLLRKGLGYLVIEYLLLKSLPPKCPSHTISSSCSAFFIKLPDMKGFSNYTMSSLIQ